MDYLAFGLLMLLLAIAILIALKIETKSPAKLRPVSNFVAIFLFYNIFAAIFYYRTNSSNYFAYPYIDRQFFDEILKTLNMNLAVLFWIIAGHLIFTITYNALPKTNVIVVKRTPKNRLGLYAAVVIAIILAFLLYYQDSLISRQAYTVEDESQVIRTLLMMLILLSAFLSGTISRERPILGLILASIIIVVLIAHGSRRAAIAPAIFFLGKYLDSSPKASSYIGVGATSVLLLAVSLAARNLESQGLAHIAQVFEFSDFGNLPIQNIYHYILNNALMGFPMSHYVSKNMYIEAQVIIASLNPLPGLLAWNPSYNERLHIGIFFPINGLGTLHGADYMVSVVSAVYFGFLLSIVNRFHFKAVSQKKTVIAATMLVLSGLATIFFLQYGLRHAIRPLYYAAILGMVGSLLSSFARSKRNKD